MRIAIVSRMHRLSARDLFSETVSWQTTFWGAVLVLLGYAKVWPKLFRQQYAGQGKTKQGSHAYSQ